MKAVLLLIAFVLASFSVTEAQQPGNMPRIGYVAASSREGGSAHRDFFEQGLRDFGYVERKNIVVEYRFLDGISSRSSAVVAELLQLGVDVIVSTSPIVIAEAKRLTNSVPIVMVTIVDPVVTGLVASLARPGGNVTGITRLTRDLSGKSSNC
jgi:putative tryptophan/tyrosine transport system substrate-binding protein